METEIPTQHEAVLLTVSKNKPVGGTAALTKLYRAAQAVSQSKASITIRDVLTSRLDINDMVVATATDAKTGVYVQLSQQSEKHSVLMTIGQKYAIEYSGITPEFEKQINTKIF